MDTLLPPYAVEEVRFIYHCSTDGSYENQDGMLLDAAELCRVLCPGWLRAIVKDQKVKVPFAAWVSPRELMDVPAVAPPANLKEHFEATFHPLSIEQGTHGKQCVTYKVQENSNLFSFLTFADAHKIPVGAFTFGPRDVITIDWAWAI